MLGRTPPGITAVKPLRGGVIANFEMARKMLDYFISRVLRRFPFLRLRIMITVPYGTTQVERRAVLSAGKRAGVKEACLIEEPIAAAIGGGLPVAEPRGCFIVNFGGGVTEIAVISLRYCSAVRCLGMGDDRRNHSALCLPPLPDGDFYRQPKRPKEAVYAVIPKI